MRYRRIIVGAAPALLAAAMLQPGAEPSPAPAAAPTAAQIDAAILSAQRDAGLPAAPRRR
jgi:hypothetical protein